MRKSKESQTSNDHILNADAPTGSSITSPDRTWIPTSPLIAAVCSTTIMGGALAVPLATMSAPAELRGVVLSMSLGVFSTIMAVTAGAALTTQRRPR